VCGPIQVPTPAAIGGRNKSNLGNSGVFICFGAPRCEGEFCEDQPRWPPNLVSLADVFAIDREPACCRGGSVITPRADQIRSKSIFLFATCHHVIVWNL
jgi:hypothetical protein